MTSKDLSIFNSLRPFSVGFDDMFEQFENMLGNGSLTTQSNYPPYNIRKTGKDRYSIEVALAGFSKKDVEVPWNLKSWGEERLKKKMDVIMLREMCAVRSIELPSDRPRKQTCITKLMEWKKGYDKMAPEQNQTQAKAPATKKAKTDHWEPTVKWPEAHDQFQSYCGNMPGLMSYYEEKNLSTRGGMMPSHVKTWLSQDPENRVPKWLKRLWDKDPRNVSADHIIPDKLGGHPWPHNYFLMPSDDNSHFNASVEKEKKKYVGAAYETASSFARWVRDAARARIDYSRFDPVDARFIGRA